MYKSSNYQSFPCRLIEWLEAARSWGVDHVTLYLHSAPPAMRAVLDLYLGQGFLTVIPWMNPGHHPNAPALQRAFYDTQRCVPSVDKRRVFFTRYNQCRVHQ